MESKSSSSIPTFADSVRLVSNYGLAYKAVLNEKFGDGIMSAISFSTKVEREEDDKGTWVKITLRGKWYVFLCPGLERVCVILTKGVCNKQASIHSVLERRLMPYMPACFFCPFGFMSISVLAWDISAMFV